MSALVELLVFFSTLGLGVGLLLCFVYWILLGYWHQRADERHGNPPQCNQELLVVRDNVGRPPGELGVSKSLSHRFNGHFPGEPGLAGVYWSKGWWRWWWQLDYRSYKSCKAPAKSSPPTSIFLQAGCHSCHPINSVKALKGKISHSMDLLTPRSPAGLPTLSDH